LNKLITFIILLTFNICLAGSGSKVIYEGHDDLNHQYFYCATNSKVKYSLYDELYFTYERKEVNWFPFEIKNVIYEDMLLYKSHSRRYG
jgi:hypothetical protein